MRFFFIWHEKVQKSRKKIGLKYDTFFSHDMKKCIKVEKTKIGLKCDTFFHTFRQSSIWAYILR